MERKMIDLGWCMARIEPVNKKDIQLMVCSAALYDSESAEPAQSVLIYGKENLAKLRDALIECLP